MASILVIDDDLAVRGLFEQVLQSDGHTVYLAATAAAAYDVLRCSPVEIVITDLNIPVPKLRIVTDFSQPEIIPDTLGGHF